MKKMPKEQRTPFKELSLGQKFSYIFGYYKYYMLAALIVIVAVGSTVYYHYKNYYESVCSIYVADGKIPKGRKQQGFKEIFWLKSDLDKFKNGRI